MPSRISKKEINKRKQAILNRMKGLFVNEETMDDLKLALKDFFKAKNDKYLSYVHHVYGFCVYNNMEFQETLALWKKNKVVVLDCNIHERVIDGKTIYFFVAQHENIEQSPSMCPLAMALGYLVSGYTYIVKDKADIETIKQYLAV